MPFALSRWPWWRRWFGSRSERAAARFLRRLGYRIVICNWTCPGGEIDLVALDWRCVVFVEVRSTADPSPERPLLSINREKQRRMTRAATHFIQRYRLHDQQSRFDVLILSWPPPSREPSIWHYISAFEAT